MIAESIYNLVSAWDIRSQFRILTGRAIQTFFTCPHRAIDNEHWHKLTGNLLSNLTECQEDVGQLTDKAVQVLSNTSSAFKVIEHTYKIVNIYQLSDGTNCHLVVDEWAATLETAHEVHIGRETSHHMLSSFQKGQAWVDLWSYLTEPLCNATGQFIPRTCIELYQSFRNFESLKVLEDAKHTQFQQQPTNQHLLERLCKNKRLDEIERWRLNQSPRKLLVHSPMDLTIGDLSILLDMNRQKSWSSGAKLLTASFAPHSSDCHESPLSRVILSFIQQICENAYDDFFSSEIPDYRATSIWTENQLWALFRTLLSGWKGDYIIFVISTFQNCSPQNHWFLKDLDQFGAGNERRIVILLGSNRIVDCIDDKIDLANEGKKFQQNCEEVKTTLDLLFQRKPAFTVVRDQLHNKIREATLDDIVAIHIMLRYLETADIPTTKAAMIKEIASFRSFNVQDMVSRVLSKLPASRQTWAHNVLSWISFARVPLTIEALGAASAIGDEVPSVNWWIDSIPQDLNKDVGHLLPILDIRDGCVRLVAGKEYLGLTEDEQKYWQTTICDPDWMICQKCVHVLSIDEVEGQH